MSNNSSFDQILELIDSVEGMLLKNQQEGLLVVMRLLAEAAPHVERINT